MLNPLKVVFIATFLIVLVHGAETDSGHPQNLYRLGGMPITDWLVAGPLAVSSDDIGVRKDLEIDGFNESQVLRDGLYSFAKSNTGKLPIRRFTMHGLIDFYDSYSLDKAENLPPTFFLEAIVRTEVACRALLLIGSDGLAKIWVNGVHVGDKSSRRDFETYDASFPVSLEAGTNRVSIKIIRARASCGIVARLEGSPESAAAHVLEEDGTWLENLVVPRLEDIRLTMRPHLPVKLPIMVVHPLIAIPPSHAPETIDSGLYTAHLTWHDREWEEQFVVGSIPQLIRSLKSRLSRAVVSEEARINLATLTRRIDVLMDPENEKKDDREWQRKTIYTMAELSSALDEIESGREAFRGKPGLHIRGFKSQIDNTERHYRLFIPDTYRANSGKLPLIVMVATTFSGSRPFIESAFIAHQFEAERMDRLAARVNSAILWPGYPCQPYNHPIEDTHLDEVLQAVEKDYTIDRMRISLIATCRAAGSALEFAEHWPERFSGIGLLDPIVDHEVNRPDEKQYFRRSPVYQNWVRERNPEYNLHDITSTPLFGVYDQPAKGHGTLEQLAALTTTCSSENLNMSMTTCVSSLYHTVGWAGVVDWVSHQMRISASETLSIAAQRRAEQLGPICAALAQPFIVVEPTSGPVGDVAAANRLIDAFLSAWRTNHYGTCRRVSDVDLTPSEMQHYNLVLFGNAEVNRVWSRFTHSVPLELTTSSITYKGVRVPGLHLSVQALAPNPESPNRRLILIGSADLPDALFGTMELSIDGWFDCAIWGLNGSGQARLVKAL